MGSEARFEKCDFAGDVVFEFEDVARLGSVVMDDCNVADANLLTNLPEREAFPSTLTLTKVDDNTQTMVLDRKDAGSLEPEFTVWGKTVAASDEDGYRIFDVAPDLEGNTIEDADNLLAFEKASMFALDNGDYPARPYGIDTNDRLSVSSVPSTVVVVIDGIRSSTGTARLEILSAQPITSASCDHAEDFAPVGESGTINFEGNEETLYIHGANVTSIENEYTVTVNGTQIVAMAYRPGPSCILTMPAQEAEFYAPNVTIENESIVVAQPETGARGYIVHNDESQISTPTVAFTGVGTGASATPLIENGLISGFTIENGGSGYKAAKVDIRGVGSGAAVEPVFGAGGIVSYNVTNGGTGYTGAKLTFAGGGSGEDITPLINEYGTITGFTINDGGSNFGRNKYVWRSTYPIISGNGSGFQSTYTHVATQLDLLDDLPLDVNAGDTIGGYEIIEKISNNQIVAVSQNEPVRMLCSTVAGSKYIHVHAATDIYSQGYPTYNVTDTTSPKIVNFLRGNKKFSEYIIAGLDTDKTFFAHGAGIPDGAVVEKKIFGNEYVKWWEGEDGSYRAFPFNTSRYIILKLNVEATATTTLNGEFFVSPVTINENDDTVTAPSGFMQEFWNKFQRNSDDTIADTEGTVINLGRYFKLNDGTTKIRVNRIADTGRICKIGIRSGGRGYYPTASIVGHKGQGATAKVVTDDSGVIVEVQAVETGSGYDTSDVVDVQLVSDKYSGDITPTVNSDGSIESLAISNQQIGYDMRIVMLTSDQIVPGKDLVVTSDDGTLLSAGRASSVRDVVKDWMAPSIQSGDSMYYNTCQNVREHGKVESRGLNGENMGCIQFSKTSIEVDIIVPLNSKDTFWYTILMVKM